MDMKQKMAELDARIAARKAVVDADRKNPFAERPKERPDLPPPRLIENAYDVLKYFALILLPALTTFYITVSKIWGWPLRGQIAGTMVALNTFFGTIVGVFSWRHKKALYWSERNGRKD